MQRKMQELPQDALKPRPLVTGSDLIADGYRPGPAFARILAAVEDAQLESRIHTRDEAMALVRARFRRPDGIPA
jgi:hypothetical protein